jgi:hypothetical protein
MTLNQVVALINQIAQGHQQIEDVYFGELIDFLSRGEDNIYPSLCYEVTNANISLDGKALSISFSFYFFDRMLPEDADETEVLSDRLSVAQDIVAQLTYNNYEFDVVGGIPVQFFIEKTSDLLAGVRADIQLELPYLSNRCVVPTTYTP